MIVALISGRGSNLQALLEAGLPVSGVLSNRADAKGLELAAARGIATRVVEHARFASREAFESALGAEIERFAPRLVLLAGFTRVLTPGFVARYEQRMLNIHPALLPAFGGKGMWGRAVHEAVLRAGVERTGVTVHFVTERYDEGDVLAQWPVPVRAGDDADTLAARVLEVEHLLYPLAAQRLCRALAAGEEPTPLPAPDDGHARLVELVREAFSAR